MITTEAPDNFPDALVVVGCFVEHDGKILMLHRVSDKPEGTTWCSPGGKLDAGETPEMAIVREVMEETGIAIDPTILERPVTFYVTYPNGKNFIYHKFRAMLDMQPEVTLSSHEHTEYVWDEPANMFALPLIQHEDDTIRHFYGI